MMATVPMLEPIQDDFSDNGYMPDYVPHIHVSDVLPTYIDSAESSVRKLKVPDVSGEVPTLVTEIQYVIEVKPPLLKKLE